MKILDGININSNILYIIIGVSATILVGCIVGLIKISFGKKKKEFTVEDLDKFYETYITFNAGNVPRLRNGKIVGESLALGYKEFLKSKIKNVNNYNKKNS